MTKYRYSWINESPTYCYTEEGWTASGYGDWPKGSHQPDWIIQKQKGRKGSWYAKSRMSSGAVGPFATAGKAKAYIESATEPTKETDKETTAMIDVIAYKTTLEGKREYLFIFEDYDNSPVLAYLPTHLTDEQVVAFCETCGWRCTSVDRT